eukprot:6242903-Amphidinium_carterae.1
MSANSSTGPDGWRVAELQLLLKLSPKTFAFDLLRLFQHMERTASDWPEPLHLAWVSPIPKPGVKTAYNIRPIAVYGALYRL